MTTGILGGRGLAVIAVVHEVLAHRSTGHRRDVLQRSGIGRRGAHDDRVVHGTVALKGLDDARNGGRLLTDGDVNADHVVALLVDDRINRNGGLTGLTVADDELALSAADRNHRVDSEDTGLHGLMHGLTRNNAGGLELDRAHAVGLDRSLAVDGHTERVHDTAEHGLAGGYFHDTTGRLDLIVFLDCGDVTEEHGADFVLFEVLSQAVDDLAALAHELEELACHSVLQPVDTCDTVAHLDDGSDLARFDTGIEGIELLAQCLVNRLCGDFSH